MDEALSLGERVSVHVKERAMGDRHILLCMSDTGGCNAVLPLIGAALHDPRVRAVSLNITCAAQRQFEQSPYRHHFAEVGTSMPLACRRSLLCDREVVKAPLTDVVVTYATYAGLEDLWLLQGKSVFNARRIVYVQDNWLSFNGFNRIRHLVRDPVDSIICNDTWAGSAITSGWRESDSTRPEVVGCGTGVVVAHEESEAQRLRDTGIEKLGIRNGEDSILFVGSYDKSDTKLSTRIFFQFADDLVRSTSRQHVILLRPHPSDADSAELRRGCEQLASSNVRIVWADSSIVAMNEVGYAANRVVGVDSTEVVIAALRGKPAAFLSDRTRETEYQQRFAGYAGVIEASAGRVGVVRDCGTMMRFLDAKGSGVVLSHVNNSGEKIGFRMLDAVLGDIDKTA